MVYGEAVGGGGDALQAIDGVCVKRVRRCCCAAPLNKSMIRFKIMLLLTAARKVYV